MDEDEKNGSCRGNEVGAWNLEARGQKSEAGSQNADDTNHKAESKIANGKEYSSAI
jgi:hypothetical protein